MKSRLKFGDPIRVTWTDACGGGGWKEPWQDGIEVVNVGVFVLQNKNGLCMASGVHMDDRELVLEPSFVPRGMLKKVQKLR